MKVTIQDQIQMSYDEYVQYLLNKYGGAVCDYFCTESCKSKSSKITRTKEGLFCHHIDENKEILLSTPEVARTHSFEFQKADHLVYADYIEHLLLHIKIVKEDMSDKGLGLGGVIMIASALNDYYRHGLSDGWKKYCTDKIKDRYDEYIAALRDFYSFSYFDPELSSLLQAPILAQGWYGKINYKVHKEIYETNPPKEFNWRNSDLLEYLEKLNTK